MEAYRVEFSFKSSNAEEVQFKCPFHGADKKPSARFYRSTQTCYCWYCRKKWDVISFIMQKEVLNYYQALSYIPKKYDIDLSSIPDGPALENYKEKETINEFDLNEKMRVVRNKIYDLCGKIGLDRYKVLCTFYQNLCYKKYKGFDIQESIYKLQNKISEVTR